MNVKTVGRISLAVFAVVIAIVAQVTGSPPVEAVAVGAVVAAFFVAPLPIITGLLTLVSAVFLALHHMMETICDLLPATRANRVPPHTDVTLELGDRSVFISISGFNLSLEEEDKLLADNVHRLLWDLVAIEKQAAAAAEDEAAEDLPATARAYAARFGAEPSSNDAALDLGRNRLEPAGSHHPY